MTEVELVQKTTNVHVQVIGLVRIYIHSINLVEGNQL